MADPKGECILVSFGPHTVADKSGKAVVRERLAFVEAEEQSGVAGAARSTTASRSYFIPPPPTPLVPPAPFGAVAGTGEPAGVYVPNSPYGRPVDGVPPGSASPAPSANFIPMPVPSWRKDVEYFPSGPDFPWANTQNAAKRAQMKATGVEPAPPAVGTPTPVQPVGPGAKLPTPAAPSRSFPQGIHVDGSKAKLPPLPEDEMEDDAVDSESAEPRPSPQTKKPRKPQPASDESTTKASFAHRGPQPSFCRACSCRARRSGSSSCCRSDRSRSGFRSTSGWRSRSSAAWFRIPGHRTAGSNAGGGLSPPTLQPVRRRKRIASFLHVFVAAGKLLGEQLGDFFRGDREPFGRVGRLSERVLRAGSTCSRTAAVRPVRSRCSGRRPRNGPQPEMNRRRNTGLSPIWQARMPPMRRSNRRRSPSGPPCASCRAKHPNHSSDRSPMPRP